MATATGGRKSFETSISSRKPKSVAICDKSAVSRRKAEKAYPAVLVTDDANELMTSPDIDAIAVVTPVWTHYELAKAALENGKHIFVEKPFTSNSAQAEELIALAAKKNLKIMVDHTFLFTAAVQKIKQLLEEGALGKLYYYDSTRVNLGLFQHDVNVIWDLAPHDLSIMDHLIAGKLRKPLWRPARLTSTGTKISLSLRCISLTRSSPTSTSTGCRRSKFVQR